MTMKFSEPNVISWIETNLNRISIGLRKTCQVLSHRSFHDGKTISYSYGYLSYRALSVSVWDIKNCV